MDGKELAEYIDNQRWLLNNGLLNDASKNQLFMYGSIVHKDVQAVELDIDTPNKAVSYRIFVTPSLLKKINKFQELSTATSFFGMWRFKRLIENDGNLNFNQVLGNFVRDYCGPKWTTNVKILSDAEYVEDFGEKGENNKPGSEIPDRQPDGR